MADPTSSRLTIWIVLAVVIACTIAAAEGSLACDRDWVRSVESGTCLRFYHTYKRSWQSARKVCKEKGGDLVKIINKRMNDFIGGEIPYYKAYYWIGLHDQVHEGRFRWRNETTQAGYTRWGRFQPTRCGKRDEDCVALGPHRSKLTWFDKDCRIRRRFICEVPGSLASDGQCQVPSITNAVITNVRESSWINIGDEVKPQCLHGMKLSHTRRIRCEFGWPKAKFSVSIPTCEQGDRMCPAGWTHISEVETCIKFHDDWQCRKGARAACKAEGGDLVKIRTAIMNSRIKDQVPYHYGSFWIDSCFLREGEKLEWSSYPWVFNEKWIRCEEPDQVFLLLRGERDMMGWSEMPSMRRGRARYICEMPLSDVCQVPNMTNTVISNARVGAWVSNGYQIELKCLYGFELSHNRPVRCNRGQWASIPRCLRVPELCNDGWKRVPGSRKCLKVYNHRKSWDEARAACKAEMGDLVKIGDERTNFYVAEMTQSKACTVYWIGLRRKYLGGKFQWVDGTDNVGYQITTDWEIVNSPPDTSTWTCVVIMQCRGLRFWVPADCSIKLPYICEKPLPPPLADPFNPAHSRIVSFLTHRSGVWCRLPAIANATIVRPPQYKSWEDLGDVEQLRYYLPISNPKEKVFVSDGDFISPRCAYGMERSDFSPVTCENGRWSQIPFCALVQCQVPLIADATISNVKVKAWVSHGDVIKPECSPGMRLSHSRPVWCDNGRWTHIPTCEADMDSPEGDTLGVGSGDGETQEVGSGDGETPEVDSGDGDTPKVDSEDGDTPKVDSGDGDKPRLRDLYGW